MDSRIVAFADALRRHGARVSLAESADALQAAARLGVQDRSRFRAALRATLVKDASDLTLFERLFPLFFGSAPPPAFRAEDVLSEEGLRLLRQALAAMQAELAELLERLLEARPISEAEMERALREAGLAWAGAAFPSRLARSAMERLGIGELRKALRDLLEALRQLGMSASERAELEAAMEANLAALAAAVRRAAAAGLAERRSPYFPGDPSAGDLTERPFRSLSEREADALRREAARMAARLRTRASLRQKRGEGRRLDAKSTLRRSLRYSGVPFARPDSRCCATYPPR
jgi:hypothetical protein